MTFGRCVVVIAAALLIVLLVPSCSQTANVTEVWMSLDGDGSRRRNEFFTDTKEIHCVAKAGVGRDGVTIESFIRSVQLFDFDSGRYETIDAILAYAEFKADRAGQATTVDLSLTPRDPRKPDAPAQDTPPF